MMKTFTAGGKCYRLYHLEGCVKDADHPAQLYLQDQQGRLHVFPGVERILAYREGHRLQATWMVAAAERWSPCVAIKNLSTAEVCFNEGELKKRFMPGAGLLIFINVLQFVVTFYALGAWGWAVGAAGFWLSVWRWESWGKAAVSEFITAYNTAS